MNDTNSEGCGWLAGHRQPEESAHYGQIACGTLGGLPGRRRRRRSTATPPFRSTDETFRPVRRVMILRCSASERPSGTSAGRRVRITPAMCTSPQLGAYQPFRPRRAANSSTALLNTRQVAATHPANFAGLTAVGFCGHMMRHASAVFTGVQFDADSSVLGDLAGSEFDTVWHWDLLV